MTRPNLAAGAVAALALTAGQMNGAQAQEFPTKPIRLIVPFSPGGGTDLLSRLLAQKMYETWGHPLVVDFRVGANGDIGTEIVAKAPADGYTLLFHTGSFSINPLLRAKPRYDSQKDFAPISLTATAPQLLVAHPSVPAGSVKELVALSKSTKLSYATPGIGSVGHLSGELLTMASGIAMVHVPYKGSGTAVSDLLGGHVQLMFAAPGSMIAHVKSGKLKALAITSEQRITGLEEVPTFAEAGYPPVVAVNWFGVLATAGTPENVVRKINQEIVRIIALPEVRERIISSGYAPVSSTPQEFARFLSAEHVKWQKVIKAAGVRLE